MNEINIGLIVMLWSTALMFLMWKTDSFRASYSTSTLVISMFIISILHRLFGEICCLGIMMVVLTVLVWRILPCHKTDTWKKEFNA